MGTSQSSGGPGAGVPMVPSWTPDPPEAEVQISEGDATPADQDGSEFDNTAQQPTPLAPAARFLGTRRNLSDYARGGERRDLRRSLRHYVRTGYGGSGTATRRFGGTAATAAALGGALARAAAGQPAAPGSPFDPTLLTGRSAQEVMGAVVEAVRPVDGTQDAEVARAAIQDALSDLLTRFPEANLLDLDTDQRNFAIERFTAIDVFRRFELDVGKVILDKAPSAAVALSRLKQARDYVKETVASVFRKLRNADRNLTADRINGVVRDALHETFQVFEGYTQ